MPDSPGTQALTADMITQDRGFVKLFRSYSLTFNLFFRSFFRFLWCGAGGFAFADAVTWRLALVLRSLGTAGSGGGGFRRAGGGADRRADAAEPGADPAGGHHGGGLGALPGQPDVGGERPGEPELGEAGDDEPGPAVGGGGVAQQRPVPAQPRLDEPEDVLRGKAGLLA
jgi:hypothetical protein